MKEQILELVCVEFEVSENILKHKTRVRWASDARKAYAYLMRKHTNISFANIGEFINRDHSTIVHAERSANNLIKFDKDFKQKIDTIEMNMRLIDGAREKRKRLIFDIDLQDPNNLDQREDLINEKNNQLWDIQEAESRN